MVLRVGLRGLPGGWSVARLLADFRGHRNTGRLPRLTTKDILKWADAHKHQHGRWPRVKDGPIPGTSGESWVIVDIALRKGTRGLLGRSSLTKLLSRHRGIRNPAAVPKLSLPRIVRWADAHKRRTGNWPTAKSGPVHENLDENWTSIDNALRCGLRGFVGGSSLPQLLSEHRGVRRHFRHPPLSVKQILGWADTQKKRTGSWPHEQAGPIPDTTDETWWRVNMALKQGKRGLAGGITLAELLAKRRRVFHTRNLPKLTERQIQQWIRAYLRRYGRGPKATSGRIPNSHGETWSKVDSALRSGSRGLLVGGSSLAILLAKDYGIFHHGNLPGLSENRIGEWIDSYCRRHGRPPTRDSGIIPNSNGETWSRVSSAFVKGTRGLRGGSSLAKFIKSRRWKVGKRAGG